MNWTRRVCCDRRMCVCARGHGNEAIAKVVRSRESSSDWQLYKPHCGYTGNASNGRRDSLRIELNRENVMRSTARAINWVIARTPNRTLQCERYEKINERRKCRKSSQSHRSACIKQFRFKIQNINKRHAEVGKRCATRCWETAAVARQWGRERWVSHIRNGQQLVANLHRDYYYLASPNQQREKSIAHNMLHAIFRFESPTHRRTMHVYVL